MTQTNITLQPGTSLKDRYRIETQIGQGGMGSVYRARDTLLHRDVALKVLSVAGLGTTGRERLLNEARAAAQLDHPNIVAIYDVEDSADPPFIVMQLVVGETVAENRPENILEVVAVCEGICEALAHAHQKDIVHRDVKPGNVMVTTDGQVKLMDFGIARSPASHITQEGDFKGTVNYIAPEQAIGARVDRRTDLYALGVVMYEFATSKLPFIADDPFLVITQHIHAPLVPPRAVNETIPRALNDLIVRLMGKKPDDRPESAEEVLQILEQIKTGVTPEPAVVEEMPAASLLERIVRGRIVGRERELSEARALWKKVTESEGQMLLISGEPGIGKTRLVREVVTQAEVTGGKALVGACFTEGGIPYAPFAQIVHAVLGPGSEDELSLPPFVLADLLKLVPSLQPHYPDIKSNPNLDPKSEQYRMFENLVAFCSLLASHAPLLLAFEDLHWAEEGTLEMLRHLARRTRDQPVLLVGTYREAELNEVRPFYDWLVSLNRERLAVRMKLTRLGRTATEAMLEALFSEPITPDFLDGIYFETEGNPFFIEEVVKGLVEEGKLYFAEGRWHRPEMEELEIPQSVRVAIQSRMSKLDESIQEALTLAAIIGREFEYDTLSKAIGMPEDQLIEALEIAEGAHLISEISSQGGGTFSFAHALIPSTLEESISGLRRRRLHRLAAEAIQQLKPDDFETLALHFSQAGDREQGLVFSHKAAQRAEKLYAYETAIHYLKTSLELLEGLDQETLRLELMEKLADIYVLTGHHPRAVGIYQEALQVIQNQAPSDRMNFVRLDRKIGETISHMTWFVDRQRFEDLSRASLERALSLVGDQLPHPERVHILAALSRHSWLTKNPPDWEAAYSYALKAVVEAEALGDPIVLSTALDALENSHSAQESFLERLEICQQRLGLSDRLPPGNEREQTKNYLRMGQILTSLGRYQEAISYLNDAKRQARNIQALDLRYWAIAYEAICQYWLDNWELVLELDEERRVLEDQYPRFSERVGATCFQISLSATVFGLMGDVDSSRGLQDESQAIMIEANGEPENWTRGNHY